MVLSASAAQYIELQVYTLKKAFGENTFFNLLNLGKYNVAALSTWLSSDQQVTLSKFRYS